MKSDTIQFPCSACGARLQFDPAAAQLLCQHCGFSEAIPQSQVEVVELDFDSFKPKSVDWEMETRQWHCEQCGADTITERTVTSFRCPFCASNLVFATDELIDKHTPDSLLPFRITEAEALTRFQEWIHSLWFRPNALKAQARTGKVSGTYVPFWTFDALTHSFWTAQAGTYYYVKNSKGERQRKIRWRHVNGTYDEFFDDELVSGSTVLDETLWRQIEPFPTDELLGFQEEYLAGHMALAYETDMLECWPSAQKRIDHRIRDACRRSIPGDTHRGLAVTTSYLNRTYKLCLLPIWIAAYRYRGTNYSYIVNGVNGNIAGRAPWSIVKILSAVSVLGTIFYAAYSHFQ